MKAIYIPCIGNRATVAVWLPPADLKYTPPFFASLYDSETALACEPITLGETMRLDFRCDPPQSIHVRVSDTCQPRVYVSGANEGYALADVPAVGAFGFAILSIALAVVGAWRLR